MLSCTVLTLVSYWVINLVEVRFMGAKLGGINDLSGISSCLNMLILY